MTFLENCWYAAGFSAEMTQEPIIRTLLGRPVVLYRTAAGQAVALGDRCPHRFAPLHQGKVFDDAIRCPYHGLRFGPDGRCVDNPIGNGKIPQAAHVPSYPLREVDGIIWLWFGEQVPDEDAIIRFEIFGEADCWATVEDHMPVAASYALVADNLLDLSHAEFLHPALATEGFNKRVQFSMAQEDDVVIARNWRPSEPISGLFRFGMGEKAPEFVDHRSIVRWHAPAILSVEVGATYVGRPPEEGLTTITAHLITPETDKSCHYFWKFARDFRLDDDEFATRLHDIVQGAFDTEDRPMIEAQQRYMGDQSLEELRPVLLTSDAASARARRILNEKLASQTAQFATQAAE